MDLVSGTDAGHGGGAPERLDLGSAITGIVSRAEERSLRNSNSFECYSEKFRESGNSISKGSKLPSWSGKASLVFEVMRLRRSSGTGSWVRVHRAGRQFSHLTCSSRT